MTTFTTALVIDPGYSSFKFCEVKQGKILPPWKEPTRVSILPDYLQTELDEMLPTSSSTIEWQGQKYLVGNQAQKGLPVFHEDNPEILFKTFLPLFLLKIKQTHNPQLLAFCISPADWRWKDAITETIKSIFPDASFKFFSQGAGAWITAGKPRNCIIIDIGFNTVDVLPFQNAKFQKELCFSLRGAGLISFLQNLEKDDPHLIAQKLEAGDEKLVSIVKEHYPQYLMSILESKVPAGRFVFCGGGANFFKNAKLPVKFIVVKKPTYANVFGVAYYLNSK